MFKERIRGLYEQIEGRLGELGNIFANNQIVEKMKDKLDYVASFVLVLISLALIGGEDEGGSEGAIETEDGIKIHSKVPDAEK